MAILGRQGNILLANKQTCSDDVKMAFPAKPLAMPRRVQVVTAARCCYQPLNHMNYELLAAQTFW